MLGPGENVWLVLENQKISCRMLSASNASSRQIVCSGDQILFVPRGPVHQASLLIWMNQPVTIELPKVQQGTPVTYNTDSAWSIVTLQGTGGQLSVQAQIWEIPDQAQSPVADLLSSWSGFVWCQHLTENVCSQWVQSSDEQIRLHLASDFKIMHSLDQACQLFAQLCRVVAHHHWHLQLVCCLPGDLDEEEPEGIEYLFSQLTNRASCACGENSCVGLDRQDNDSEGIYHIQEYEKLFRLWNEASEWIDMRLYDSCILPMAQRAFHGAAAILQACSSTCYFDAQGSTLALNVVPTVLLQLWTEILVCADGQMHHNAMGGWVCPGLWPIPSSSLTPISCNTSRSQALGSDWFGNHSNVNVAGRMCYW